MRAGVTIMIMVLAACDSPTLAPNVAGDDSIARGRDAALRHGCGACHAMPGIGWPRGTAGPGLERFAGQALIAGRLPNRPDMLARFVRDAPSLVPGSAMPAMPMSDRDAADIAAWLQTDHGQ